MKLSTKDMTRVALFSSLICVASLILKFGGDLLVPFSVLPFMVMLAGGILGPRLAALSVAIYVLIGMLGVPVFAKPPFGGLTYILQPSFGFLPGFILAAFFIGKFLEKISSEHIIKYIGAMLLGIAVIYIVGIPYLYAIVKFYLGKPFSLWKAIQIGMLPFVGLDILKGVLAALLARAVQHRLRC
ncbi:MAG: biotin transporter BioY [Firmicutes bacterium HGW-Firmicutes-12]|jgi:biotin transport system substrate-specific component|nr:MAG: biotin transporter BioY [Firmicutes bacterium HGW-Firmicutes-12]